MAVFSGAVGWFLGKITSDRNFEAILDQHIIDDLKFIEEYMDWWVDNQGPDGKVNFIGKGSKNAKKVLELPAIFAKHRDWILIDRPQEKRAEGIRLDASNSIDAIRRHGHKQAKKIRKKELQNSSQKWDVQKLYPKKKH